MKAPAGEQTLGRTINFIGKPIDELGPVTEAEEDALCKAPRNQAVVPADPFRLGTAPWRETANPVGSCFAIR